MGEVAWQQNSNNSEQIHSARRLMRCREIASRDGERRGGRLGSELVGDRPAGRPERRIDDLGCPRRRTRTAAHVVHGYFWLKGAHEIRNVWDGSIRQTCRRVSRGLLKMAFQAQSAGKYSIQSNR